MIFCLIQVMHDVARAGTAISHHRSEKAAEGAKERYGRRFPFKATRLKVVVTARRLRPGELAYF